MQKFIAHYTREIVARLSEPYSDIQNSVKAHQILEVAQSTLSPPSEDESHALDVSVAERINGDSFIFPDTEADTDSNWCILSATEAEKKDNFYVFRIHGRLEGKTSPEYFVDKSYDYILGRPIDPDGQKIYAPLIRNMQLTKRDVLRVLLSSDEYGEKGRKLIIVPEPSSWLSMTKIDKDSRFFVSALTVCID